MLTAHRLAKSFALNSLFKNATFFINPGDRVGLVGPNGCGKTTLLRLLAGEETADEGQVTLDPGLRLGYLPQGFALDARATIAGVMGQAVGDVVALEAELVKLAQALGEQPNDADLQSQYDTILGRISVADTGRAARIMAGLGLDEVPPDQLVGRLSGGQKTRLNLALVLLGDPQLLLLDEPTNHLDIGMLEWLEGWLNKFAGAALIVSHDRTFLDRCVNRILAMDPQSQSVQEYAGNYGDYVDRVQLEREKQWVAYKDQQQEIRRLKQDIARAKAQAEYTERQASSVRIGGEMMKLKGYKDYQQSIAKKVAKKAKAREGKLDRYLDSEERVKKPSSRRNMRLDFAKTNHLGRSVITLEDLSVGYDVESPLLIDLRLEVKPGARITITGPNGSGKSSLLRTISGEILPLAGRVNRGPSVHLGIMSQEQTGIDQALTPLESIQGGFANETAARTFLGYFLFSGEEPLRLNSQLSFGQRARLALALMVVEGCNVLLLDEPINHLDIPGRSQFEEALSNFAGTVLAVVHDRAFIERFASEIWWVEDRGIRQVIG